MTLQKEDFLVSSPSLKKRYLCCCWLNYTDRDGYCNCLDSFARSFHHSTVNTSEGETEK